MPRLRQVVSEKCTSLATAEELGHHQSLVHARRHGQGFEHLAQPIQVYDRMTALESGAVSKESEGPLLHARLMVAAAASCRSAGAITPA